MPVFSGRFFISGITENFALSFLKPVKAFIDHEKIPFPCTDRSVCQSSRCPPPFRSGSPGLPIITISVPELSATRLKKSRPRHPVQSILFSRVKPFCFTAGGREGRLVFRKGRRRDKGLTQPQGTDQRIKKVGCSVAAHQMLRLNPVPVIFCQRLPDGGTGCRDTAPSFVPKRRRFLTASGMPKGFVFTAKIQSDFIVRIDVSPCRYSTSPSLHILVNYQIHIPAKARQISASISAKTAAAYISRFALLMSSYSTGRSASPINGLHSFPKYQASPRA